MGRRGRIHFLSNFHRSTESSTGAVSSSWQRAGTGTLEVWEGEGSETGLPTHTAEVGLGDQGARVQTQLQHGLL